MRPRYALSDYIKIWVEFVFGDKFRSPSDPHAELPLAICTRKVDRHWNEKAWMEAQRPLSPAGIGA